MQWSTVGVCGATRIQANDLNTSEHSPLATFDAEQLWEAACAAAAIRRCGRRGRRGRREQSSYDILVEYSSNICSLLVVKVAFVMTIHPFDV